MMIALHKNARTTPAIRAEIASSSASAASLAQRFGVTEATVYMVDDNYPGRLTTTILAGQ